MMPSYSNSRPTDCGCRDCAQGFLCGRKLDYSVQLDEPAPHKRIRTTTRRVYDGHAVKRVLELPRQLKDRDVPLPNRQLNWTLVSSDVYHNGHTYSVRIRHECGVTRYFSRTDWIRALHIGRQCAGCFRPNKVMAQDLGFGRARKTCAACGEPVPKNRTSYCSQACGNAGKNSASTPGPR